MQFHETNYGKRFFDGQLPKLISALTDISSALKAPRPVYQLKPEAPEDFLTELYWGDYAPAIQPDPPNVRKLAPELNDLQHRLKKDLSPEEWQLVEHYRELLDRRYLAGLEQAFGDGFRSAMTILAAGLACPTAHDPE